MIRNAGPNLAPQRTQRTVPGSAETASLSWAPGAPRASCAAATRRATSQGAISADSGVGLLYGANRDHHHRPPKCSTCCGKPTPRSSCCSVSPKRENFERWCMPVKTGVITCAEAQPLILGDAAAEARIFSAVRHEKLCLAAASHAPHRRLPKLHFHAVLARR